MVTKRKQCLYSFSDSYGQVKHFRTQKKAIFEYLKTHIATATMVSRATGVPQKSICRFKRDLERSGLLFEVYRKPCKITGFMAWFLTTGEELLPTGFK